MSLRYQGALQTVVVATLISLGLFVLVKRPRHRPAQLLTLMCLLTTGWILLDIGTTMGEQAENLGQALVFRNTSKLFTSHLIATFVCFAWFFPARHPSLHWWKVVLMFAVSLTFSALAFTSWDVRSTELSGGHLRIEYGWIHYTYSGYVILSGLYAVAILLQRLWSSESKTIRLQLKYIIIGLGITFVLATIFSVILPTFFHSYDYFFVGTLAPLTGFGGMAYAIIRHRAMGIRTAIHYTLSWLLVTSLILIPIYLLIFLTRSWLSQLGHLHLSLSVTTLFFPLFFYVRRVQPLIDRLFHQDYHRMQVGIEALIASAGSLQSLPQLASQVETTIQDLLRLPKVLLLVRNVEGNFTSISNQPLIEIEGKVGSSSTVISEQDPFLRWLISRIGPTKHSPTLSESAILSLADVVQQTEDRQIIAAAEDYFNQTSIQLCLPLIHKQMFEPQVHITLHHRLAQQSEMLVGTLNFSEGWLEPRQIDLILRLRGAITMAIDNAYLHQSQLRSQENQVQSELISTAASALAHSIKNPLGLLDANMDLLKSNLSATHHQDVRFALEDMSQQVYRIENIVQKIRNAHIGQPNLSSCQMAVILQEAIAETRKLFPDLPFNTEIANVPEILADAGQLRLALVNLLTNGFQSMSLGSNPSTYRNQDLKEQVQNSLAELAIELDAVPQSESKVKLKQGSNLIQIEIRDKGQGMAEDLVKQVMSRPFVTRKQNGTGLGLWTAKKIIENHGGTLELVSRPQIGTTVVVQLPTDCNSEQSTTDH